MPSGLCITRLQDKNLVFETLDPTPIPNKWQKPLDQEGFMNLTFALIRGSSDLSADSEELVAIGLALETIQLEVNVKFQRILYTQNPDITYAWVDGTKDPIINGDNTILGYGGYPQTPYQGKVVLNDYFTWDWLAVNFHYVMHNTLRHESYHMMGSVHSPNDPQSIMYPTYNGVTMPDDTDKKQLRDKYPVRNLSPSDYERLENAITVRTNSAFWSPSNG